MYKYFLKEMAESLKLGDEEKGLFCMFKTLLLNVFIYENFNPQKTLKLTAISHLNQVFLLVVGLNPVI